MNTPKRPSKQAPATRAALPRASRPPLPANYGVPTDTEGLLPWSHVTAQMRMARHYWVCTVSPDGHPHATPVDGLWLDDRLYFGGSSQTRRSRNLTANPAVCIHLESGTNVIILHGEAHEHRPDRALAQHLAAASAAKYGYAPKPKDYQAGGVHMFLPYVVFAWTQFPRDVTRWQFLHQH